MHSFEATLDMDPYRTTISQSGWHCRRGHPSPLPVCGASARATAVTTLALFFPGGTPEPNGRGAAGKASGSSAVSRTRTSSGSGALLSRRSSPHSAAAGRRSSWVPKRLAIPARRRSASPTRRGGACAGSSAKQRPATCCSKAPPVGLEPHGIAIGRSVAVGRGRHAPCPTHGRYSTWHDG